MRSRRIGTAPCGLRYLKELATAHGLFVEEQRGQTEQRALEARYRQAAFAARAQKMEQLRGAFAAISGGRSDARQGLDELLAELFGLHEIAYRRPYRTSAEQVDARFTFLGSDYLVEARPREAPPTEADIGAFKTKVDTTLADARGLLVSVARQSPRKSSSRSRAGLRRISSSWTGRTWA